MDRRATLHAIAIAAVSALPSKQVNAAVPAVVMWLWRAAGLFRGQAAATTARGALTVVSRHAVSSSVLAIRASRAASALRAVTAVSLVAIATDEVLAHVQGTPEDSVLRWMLAYYSVLTQSDSAAAMGMWSEPPDPRHFRHLDKLKPTYRLTRLEQRGNMEARVWVVAQNPGEPSTNHVLDVTWSNTVHGPRISSFTSLA